MDGKQAETRNGSVKVKVRNRFYTVYFSRSDGSALFVDAHVDVRFKGGTGAGRRRLNIKGPTAKAAIEMTKETSASSSMIS